VLFKGIVKTVGRQSGYPPTPAAQKRGRREETRGFHAGLLQFAFENLPRFAFATWLPRRPR
jgi:hypothetical protein